MTLVMSGQEHGTQDLSPKSQCVVCEKKNGFLCMLYGTHGPISYPRQAAI